MIACCLGHATQHTHVPRLSGRKGSLQGSTTELNGTAEEDALELRADIFPVEEWAAGLYSTARSCSAASGSVLEVEQGMEQHSLIIGENFSEE